MMSTTSSYVMPVSILLYFSSVNPADSFSSVVLSDATISDDAVALDGVGMVESFELLSL